MAFVKAMQALQPENTGYLDSVVDKLKSLNPKQYPGENIKDYIQDGREQFAILSKAGYESIDYVEWILTACASAGGEVFTTTNHKWKSKTSNYVSKFDELKTKIRNYDKTSDKMASLKVNGLSFMMVTTDLETEYDTAYADNKWEPAASTVDKSKIPSGFQANTLCRATLLGALEMY